MDDKGEGGGLHRHGRDGRRSGGVHVGETRRQRDDRRVARTGRPAQSGDGGGDHRRDSRGERRVRQRHLIHRERVADLGSGGRRLAVRNVTHISILLALAFATMMASHPPLSAAASSATPPREVLVKGATLWTMSSKGNLSNADMLVRDGKISAVGTNLSAPAGAVVIDATGKHVTPGLID